MARALDDRELFAAVAEHGSFSEAATHLGVPNSTLSRRVARLESELGVALLLRTTRHVALTAAGRAYLEGLRPLLAQLSDLEAAIAMDSSGAAIELRIAAPIGLGRPFFGPALASFREAHPRVGLAWSIGIGEAHPIRDDFDIVITDGRIIDAELIARRALRTRDVCVASPAYLERYGEPAQARDLPGYDLLADDVSRGPVRWALTRGGALTVQPALRCNDHALLTEAALHDVGIALLPMTSVQSHLQDGTLRAVLEGIVGSRRDIHIVYPRKIRRSGALSAFVTFALDYINTHGKLLGITSSSKSPEPDRTSGS